MDFSQQFFPVGRYEYDFYQDIDLFSTYMTITKI